MIHDFQESLDKEAKANPFVLCALHHFFPYADEIKLMPTGRIASQLAGQDWLVRFGNKDFFIDSKAETHRSGNMTVEYRHVYKSDKRVKPGWSVDPSKQIHFYLMAYPRLRTALLLPAVELRDVAIREEDNWQRYMKPPIENTYFDTYMAAVPFTEIKAKMQGLQLQEK